MSLLLNGFPTTLFVDSGASVNVLPLHVYQKVKPQGSKLEPTSTRIYPYGSSQPLEILGACHITVDAFGKRSSVEFVIVSHKGTTILGRDTSMEMGILHVGPPSHHTQGLHNLASELENTATETHTGATASKVILAPRLDPSPLSCTTKSGPRARIIAHVATTDHHPFQVWQGLRRTGPSQRS